MPTDAIPVLAQQVIGAANDLTGQLRGASLFASLPRSSGQALQKGP
jgi:hypothetical protein